jgi:hypothetical protein
MAILVRLPKVTKEQHAKLSAALGPTSPPALLLHVAFSDGDGVEGFQVWESEEAWASDMPRVLPVLKEAGLNVDRPPTAVPVVTMLGSKVKA